MSSRIEPFLTYYRDNPDYNDSDALNEFNLMVARNEVVQSFIAGNCTAEYLLDFLEFHGINPDIYVETIEDNVDDFIARPLAWLY